MSRKNNFSSKDKLKALQCCDRHCCLCDKQCSINIEIHHIIPVSKGGKSNFDNAIPLCFDCHAKVAQYNDEHPKGLKYKYEELKMRRNHIYDKYTSPYLPKIKLEIISIDPKEYNKARFIIRNLHQYLPCKLKTTFSVYHDKCLLHKFKDGEYGSKKCWYLNANTGASIPPRFFNLPNNLSKNKQIPKTIVNLQVQIEVIIIDKFGWEHELLPFSYIWAPGDQGWYYEPFPV